MPVSILDYCANTNLVRDINHCGRRRPGLK